MTTLVQTVTAFYAYTGTVRDATTYDAANTYILSNSKLERFFQILILNVFHFSSLHCFSIDLQSNHPDTLCVQTQNAARTRRNLPSLHTYSDEHKCNFLKSAVLHRLYSKHIIRKLIEKMHSHHNMKKRKFLILLWNENEMKTNNLEYCVQESKRTLRGLLQAKADCQARQNVKRKTKN